MKVKILFQLDYHLKQVFIYKNKSLNKQIIFHCLTKSVGLFYAHKPNNMNTKNKVQLIGTVESATVNRLDTDILKASFKIETPSSYYNEKGMKSKRVFKHLCIAYGNLAAIIDRHLMEGMEIAIEGILVQNESTNQTHVQINDLLMLSKKSK